MPRTDSSISSQLLIIESDDLGLITLCRFPSSSIPTTASKFAVGCICIDTADNFIMQNTGTVLVPVWSRVASSATMDPTVVQVATVTLATADFINTASGSLSNSQGLIVVPAAPTGYVNEFLSGSISFTAGLTPFGGGGNATFNVGSGGAAITGLIASPSLWGGSFNANVVYQFSPLSTVGIAVASAKSINLVPTVAITNPGTATGSAKVSVLYRQLPI